MSAEAPHGERRNDNKSYEIKPDISFKPYRWAYRNYWPKKGEDPSEYYEDYEHVLLLRKPVSLYGIPGHIDIISDDPMSSLVGTLIDNLPTEKPLGETYFKEIYGKGGSITYVERAYILRFGFILRTPADYAKLLNTYVDVELGKERYMAAWNLSIPRVTRNMQRLEAGEELALTEKNLFNLNTPESGVPESDVDSPLDKDFERVTYVWLPEDRKKLRTIKLTFHRFFDEGDDEQQPESILPDRERLLVRA